MHEMEQHAGIAFHRSAHVADEDQPAARHRPAARRQQHGLAAVPHVPANQAAQVERFSAAGRPSPGQAHPWIPTERRDHFPRARELLFGELLEVLDARHFERRAARGVDAVYAGLRKRGDRRIVDAGRVARRNAHLGCAEPPLLSGGAEIVHGPPLRGRAPEDAEGFVKEHPVLRTVNHQRLQREVEVRSASDVDVLEGASHVHHAAGVNVCAKRMKEPAEMQQIVKKKAHFPARARFSNSEIRSPRMETMSSWLLRRMPSVSSIVAGSSSVRSRATSAAIQSSVSDTPAAL